MDFSIKQARQLIEKHKALLLKLDNIKSIETEIKADTARIANALITGTTIKKQIFDYVEHPFEGLRRSLDTDLLMRNVYRYLLSQSAFETAQSYTDHVASNVKQYITALNPGLAGLSWVFGGKRAKENAMNAYRELTDILNGS